MKIALALKGVKQLYVDTAPLIYFVEQNPVYLDRMREIIKQIDTGSVAGFTSVLTLTEVLMHPIRSHQPVLAKAYRDILLNSAHFSPVVVTVAIAEKAAQMRAQYNLKTPDALHIASAIHTGCDAFLTNDK